MDTLFEDGDDEAREESGPVAEVDALLTEYHAQGHALHETQWRLAFLESWLKEGGAVPTAKLEQAFMNVRRAGRSLEQAEADLQPHRAKGPPFTLQHAEWTQRQYDNHAR